MLLHLSVKNIALIDEVVLNFDRGFNTLTGETGAGKSIIIDAVNLVLGERADRDLIQRGKEFALVEALFDISEEEKVQDILNRYGIPLDDDGTLILARELSATGRNVCRVNGRIVTLSALKDVSKNLVDIHGQHQHQSLLSVKNQRDLLDILGENNINLLREEVKNLYSQWRQIDKEIKKLTGKDRDSERQKDILSYQINEIRSANLKNDEEEELNKELHILTNGEKVIRGVNRAYELLYSGDNAGLAGMDILGQAMEELDELTPIDETIRPLKEGLETLCYQLEDIVFSLRTYRDEFEYNPQRINELQARLEDISDMKRKYGENIRDIMIYLENIEKEFDLLVNSHKILEQLTEKESMVFAKLVEKSRLLSNHRRNIADSFQESIMDQLAELGMEKTIFQVSISCPNKNTPIDDLQKHATPYGFDKIEFLISTNPGEPLKPLSKVVSGGEMSRIMLAFKTILAQVDNIPTMIFDEIDAGISGYMAHIVGEKMGRISISRQVICVTHLPQIAAMADTHYRIAKIHKDGYTRTLAQELDMDGKREEIAKMAGGSDLSEAGLKHSTELIKKAERTKKKWSEISLDT